MDCNWNNPGVDPYRGPVTETVAAAVQRYGMPSHVRADLVAKVRNGLSDGMVEISRTGLHSATGTASDLRDMHYGRPGRVCPGPVRRDAWPDDRRERALLYCATGTADCILVPVVCGNVSRVTWVPHAPGVGAVPSPAAPQGVPEPGTLALVLVALRGLFRRRPRPF